MRKKNAVHTLILFFISLAMILTYTSCFIGFSDPYEYSYKWMYDETHHWHSAYDYPGKTKDKGLHEFFGGRCMECGYKKGYRVSGNFQVSPDGLVSLIDANLCTEDITIPSSINGTVVKIIGSNFCRETKPEKITIPGSVEYISSDAFPYGCSIIFAEGTTAIPDGLLSRAYGIKSVTIPDSVTSIGKNAFRYSSLTSITIGNSVTSIGSDAFSYCDKLETVYVSSLSSWLGISFGSLESNPLYYAKKLYVGGKLLAGVITIPDSVTSIGSYAFHGCSELTSISIPDSVKEIGYGAFSNCVNLDAVYVSSLSSWLGISFGSVDSNPLCYAKKLYVGGELLAGDITIPSSVTSIGSYAFYGCTGLTSITIPDSVNEISYGAFYDCTDLTSVTIPYSVTKIGNYAFSYCSSLTSINYTGTRSQWNSISKASGWRDNVPAGVVIHCTDDDM